MTQYCRYCVHLTAETVCCADVPCGNDGAGRMMSDASAKCPNKCKHFQFCEIDALGENKKSYAPRKKKTDDGQVKMV